jgi:hypothetical protein
MTGVHPVSKKIICHVYLLIVKIFTNSIQKFRIKYFQDIFDTKKIN